jgi:hypothetical protein
VCGSVESTGLNQYIVCGSEDCTGLYQFQCVWQCGKLLGWINTECVAVWNLPVFISTDCVAV